MRIAALILLLINLCGQLRSQGPYELSWKREVILFGASAPLITLMLLQDPARTSLTAAEIAGLDPMDVNAFDRGATDNWSEQAAHLSDIGLWGPAGLAALSPLAFPALARQEGSYGKQLGTLAVLFLETNLLNLGFTDLVKYSVRRISPYAYNDLVPVGEKVQDPDIRKSYFSGHTSISAANSFFLAKIYADYYPESQWKPLFWGLAATVPALTGYLRVRAGKHFTTDVITGYAVGAAFGYLIPHLHRIRPPGPVSGLLISPYARAGASGLSVLLILN